MNRATVQITPAPSFGGVVTHTACPLFMNVVPCARLSIYSFYVHTVSVACIMEKNSFSRSFPTSHLSLFLHIHSHSHASFEFEYCCCARMHLQGYGEMNPTFFLLCATLVFNDKGEKIYIFNTLESYIKKNYTVFAQVQCSPEDYVSPLCTYLNPKNG